MGSISWSDLRALSHMNSDPQAVYAIERVAIYEDKDQQTLSACALMHSLQTQYISNWEAAT